MSSSTSDRYNDEVTLKDVILAIQASYRQLLLKWRFILLLVIAGALAGLVYAFLTPVEYKAECTFMLNEKDEHPGISAILGEFGIGSSGEYSLEKIIELARTRTMSTSVLLDRADVNGQSDILANHFINMLESNGEWVPSGLLRPKDDLTGFRFTTDSIGNDDRLANRALQLMNKRFNERLLADVNDVTGILTFSFQSRNEEISYELLNRLFVKLSDYYTNKSIEKQAATFNTISAKCDSLEAELKKTELELANFKDTYRSTWLYVEKTPEDRLFREIKMLSVMYGEALKNKEVAAFALANVKPFIQSIDLPIYPLQRVEALWWLQFLWGAIIGGLVGSVWVLLRKLYSEIMAA